MNTRHSLLNCLLALCLIVTCSGCTVLQNLTKQSTPAPGGQTTTTTSPGQTPPPASGSQMSGDWQIAFQFGEQTMKATMRLQQNGNEFTGEGAYETGGRQFVIKEGEISNGNEV